MKQFRLVDVQRGGTYILLSEEDVDNILFALGEYVDGEELLEKLMEFLPFQRATVKLQED